jgi:PAB1-binding protein PBP1
MHYSTSNIRKYFFLSCLLLTLSATLSQAQVKPKSSEQQKKELRKKKEKQIKEKRDLEKKLHKKHFDIQDKATKKRMKKTKKQSDRLNRSKRR